MTILSVVWSDKGESTTFRSLNYGLDNKCLVIFIELLVRFAIDLLRIFIILLIESLLRRQQRESRVNILLSISIAFFFILYLYYVLLIKSMQGPSKKKRQCKIKREKIRLLPFPPCQFLTHHILFMKMFVIDFGILQYELSFSFEIQFGLYNSKT